MNKRDITKIYIIQIFNVAKNKIELFNEKSKLFVKSYSALSS